MPRYVIERAIPAIGTAEREALRDAAHKSRLSGILRSVQLLYYQVLMSTD